MLEVKALVLKLLSRHINPCEEWWPTEYLSWQYYMKVGDARVGCGRWLFCKYYTKLHTTYVLSKIYFKQNY